MDATLRFSNRIPAASLEREGIGACIGVDYCTFEGSLERGRGDGYTLLHTGLTGVMKHTGALHLRMVMTMKSLFEVVVYIVVICSHVNIV